MAREVTARPGPGRLPAEVTSFVGRSREIAEVKRLLSTTRLVTLTGTGGTGKTRLAIRVARELWRAFPDGVWQVDLSGLGRSSPLEHAVCEVLGLVGDPGLSTMRLLVDHLAERELLLVLDNCEHLLEACAVLVNGVLRAAPRVRVLCTSREPLHVLGETVLTVPPLPLPRNGARAADTTLTRFAALTLFAERAAAVAPGFTLMPTNVQTVTEICDRLDGLPLAIELAAAQLHARSIDQLAAGLTDRFRLLSARHATPTHHRRLRETFDWSFALCSPAEQAMWARLAVFSGGFDLDAASAVCHGENLPADAVLDVLSGLIDKSILLVEHTDTQVRYRMLETIADYGLQRLRADDTRDTADETTLRRRHRDWYLRLAERFDAEWFGPAQQQWLARLRRDWVNVRAALDFCLATPTEAGSALRLTAALTYYWLAAGALREGWYWLDRALTVATAPSPERVLALHTYTRVLVSFHGDHAEALARARECRELADRLGDPLLAALAVHAAGLASLFSGDAGRAGELMAQAVAQHAQLGVSNATTVSARNTLGRAILASGDAGRADEIFAEIHAVCTANRDQWVRSQVLGSQSLSALAQGRVQLAAEHGSARLRIKRELGDTLGIATALENLAVIATAAGAPERTARLLGAADRTRQRIGQRNFTSPWLQRWWAEYLTDAREALGTAAFDRAVQDGREMDEREALAYALEEEPPEPTIRQTDDAAALPIGSGMLTRRETEVAELVAQGLSNKEIGSRLVISQRTAESHVENILRKLGFTSRVQIVTWHSRRDDR